MKKLFLLLFTLLTAAITLQAQNVKVSGTVMDNATGKAVSGATVQIGSNQVKTNSDGYFEFTGIPAGKTSVSITISGYESKILLIMRTPAVFLKLIYHLLILKMKTKVRIYQEFCIQQAMFL